MLSPGEETAARAGGGQKPDAHRAGPVRIVADSNADIPPEIAAALGIAIVPNYVYFGPELIRDGYDLSPQAFYERMAASSTPPRTTHPPIGEFLEVYERSLDGAGFSSVVAILVASTLSGTLNSAHAAAGMLADPGQVEIIDSGQLSMGIGWIAVKAAEMARSGASREEIVRASHDLRSRVRVVAMVDTLDNLVRGGRINPLTAVLGGLLQIKPVLSVRQGQVAILARARTRARALSRILEEVQSWGPISDVAVMHAAAEPLADELAEGLRALAPGLPVLVAPAGASLTAHLGLGAVGVCALSGPPG